MPRVACRVLAPQWLLVVDDYNDETDSKIYQKDRVAFDQWLAEVVKLESGEVPNWVQMKARQAQWIRDYVELSQQHRQMADASFFQIGAEGDAAYATPKGGVRAISWVQPLGDRLMPTNSPLRGCAEYQIGHYAFLNLPSPLREGGVYHIRQQDGRATSLTYSDRTTPLATLKINQLGYRPDAPEKYAYLGGWVPTVGPIDFSGVKQFEVCREPDGQVVFEGSVAKRAAADVKVGTNTLVKGIPYSGEDIYELNFSAVTNTGTFHIRIPGLGVSRSFLIKPDVYGEAFYVQARGFYHQRCGTALESPFTGWTRRPCHTNRVYACGLIGNGGNEWIGPNGKPFKEIHNLDFEVIRATMRTNASFAIYGGWHDAADYDRRESHHMALWDLLGTYELNPAAFADGQLNIPESGNGIPDLLDEAAWGLEVWTRAQESDGGVCGRIETLSHPHHRGMPDRDNDPWFKSVPTRESTLSYAASAAWLSRLLKPFDARQSADLLKHAQRAYDWALRGTSFVTRAHVTITQPSSRGMPPVSSDLAWKEEPTGHYFVGLLAAEELYRVTSDPSYRSDLNVFAPHAVRYFKVYPNFLGHSWSLYKLATAPDGMYPSNCCATARSELIRFASEREEWLRQAPYRHPWNPAKSRRWGGALPATSARYFILAWKLTGEDHFRTDALLSADFHLGCNALGLSHTTGLGSAFPCAVQDAETRADGLFEPVPGLTPYGIISIPFTTFSQVYHMTIPPEKALKAATTVSFLPPPFDGEHPPIPLWRQIGPSSRSDPLNNEFTMQETLSPAVLLFGSLLAPGWLPDASLKGRKPREANEVVEAWFRLP